MPLGDSDSPGQNVTFAGGDGVVGEGGTFGNIAHELFHTLGGTDLYGTGCYYLNAGLSCTHRQRARGNRVPRKDDSCRNGSANRRTAILNSLRAARR
jgi:hypothetical protein